MSIKLSDQEILDLFKNDTTKEKGFSLLVRKYQEKIYWHVRRLVVDHDDANDVCQNIFIKRAFLTSEINSNNIRENFIYLLNVIASYIISLISHLSEII